MNFDIYSEQYHLKCAWGPRQEDPDAIAARLRQFLDTLGEIHPTFQPWWLGRSRRASYQAVRDDLAAMIRRDVKHDEMGQVERKAGYTILGSTQGPPQGCMLVGHAGGTYETSASNELGLHAQGEKAVDKSILDYPVMKAIVLTTIACWEPASCRAGSGRFTSRDPEAEYERACWITYVPPAHAASVDLVGVPFSERTPDGGLILSATDQAYDITNPVHLDGSRRLAQATKHLNATLPAY